MRLDSNKYRVVLDSVRPLIVKPEGEPHMRCTMVALATEVPLLSVVLYALRADVLGELPELRALVGVLIKFYRYTHVLAWSDEPLQVQPQP